MDQEKHSKKWLKVLLIVVAVLLVITGAIIGVLYKAASSMGIGSGEVADYDSRVVIWENPAGNSGRSKLDDMNIDYSSNTFLSTIAFAQAIVGENYTDAERTIDTFTYNYEIKGGYESENYDDQPYLIPYLTEGNDCAVIVIPGGGFGYKSMDGTTSEGKDVAVTLQENGINAFVLHYRTNPYEYPIPELDVQRAVRYLRYHAEDYGIDPEKISMIGFSAGGTLVGQYINLIQGNDLFPAGYEADEIDKVDDHITIAAMCYPCLTYEYNKPMLFSSFDADTVRDEKSRNELLEMLDLSKHISSQSVEQFIAYGTDDAMVDPKGTQGYIEAAENAGCNVEVVVAEGQPHGFKQECYMQEYLRWIDSYWNK